MLSSEIFFTFLHVNSFHIFIRSFIHHGYYSSQIIFLIMFPAAVTFTFSIVIAPLPETTPQIQLPSGCLPPCPLRF